MDSIPRADRIDYLGVYRVSRRNAERRSIPFALSPKDYAALVERAQGHCMVSGMPFSNERIPGASRRPFAPSLDRINSSEGYHIGNVRLVSVLVNIALNEWGVEPLMRVARNLVARDESIQGQTEAWELEKTKRKKLWTPTEYVTVSDYLIQMYDIDLRVHVTRISMAARRYCDIHGITVGTIQVNSHQRKDGTWGTGPRNVYPQTILKKVCEDLLVE